MLFLFKNDGNLVEKTIHLKDYYFEINFTNVSSNVVNNISFLRFIFLGQSTMSRFVFLYLS